MQQYLDLLQNVKDNGVFVQDRTGAGTFSIFGPQLTFDLSKGFPLLTTKRLHVKSIVYELLWIIKGDTNIKYLKDNGVTIWDEWADSEGNLGPVYGKQWRYWDNNGTCIDQLAMLIDGLKNNPGSRRHIISAWNVSDIAKMALPPCHCFVQFYMKPVTVGNKTEYELTTKLTQRSVDLFLGCPYNIASYAFLTHMIAHVVGAKAGSLILSAGDAHIYKNHIDQVNMQLERSPRELPTLKPFSSDITSIEDFEFSDFIIENYNPYPSISAPVAV